MCVIFASAFCAQATLAQQRKTTPSRTALPKKKTTSARTAAPKNNDIKDETPKVANQLKNVSRYIFVLGAVANGLEDTDKLIRNGRATQSAIEVNNQNKQKVINSIRDLRAGLAALEIDFRTKPALRVFLPQIDGIAGLAGTSEELAIGGSFMDAGKNLLLVVEKLTDALAAMP
jgi:hypothetical protein